MGLLKSTLNNLNQHIHKKHGEVWEDLKLQQLKKNENLLERYREGQTQKKIGKNGINF